MSAATRSRPPAPTRRPARHLPPRRRHRAIEQRARFQSGLIDARGTINAAIINNAMLRPALGGTGLAVTGNVSLLGASQLIFQLGGLTQGTQYGFLNVNGNVYARRQSRAFLRERFPEFRHWQRHLHRPDFERGLRRRVCQHRLRQRLNTSDGFGSFLVTYCGNNLILSNFLAGGSVIAAIWTGANGNWSDGTNWSINPNFPNNGQPNPAISTTRRSRMAAPSRSTSRSRFRISLSLRHRHRRERSDGKPALYLDRRNAERHRRDQRQWRRYP